MWDGFLDLIFDRKLYTEDADVILKFHNILQLINKTGLILSLITSIILSISAENFLVFLLFAIMSFFSFCVGQIVINVILGCVYDIRVLRLRTEKAEATNAYTGSEAEDTMSADEAREQKTKLYTCKKIIITDKKRNGNCVICHHHQDDLKHCKIENDMGTREFAICDKCIQLFKDNCEG